MQTEEKIIQYLEEHYNATIATCSQNKPHAATVSYISQGLTIYFAAKANSMKVRDILANPDVALTVYKDYSDLLETKGLEYIGRAEVIRDPTVTQRIIELLMAKFPGYKTIIDENMLDMFPSNRRGSQEPEFLIIMVNPEWVRYVDAKTGFETLSI
ncbi:MAG: pyridoxamine 5'-phosphate oxidase family protein [Actinomycetota bacterium]|nr:pyridoxamine 5'-phosphate oxidase family protein [Actinomycetota bacterium]